MPVEWSEESFYKKELKKWDASKRDGGMNRNGFEEYPKMMYHTQANPLNGRQEIAVARDEISLDKTTVILDAQAFNTSCQMVVGNREEEERAIRAGWRLSQAEAVLYQEQEQRRLAIGAAHRHHEDRNMSEAAKAEAEAADRATPMQLPEIKAKPADRMAKARAAKAAKKLSSEPPAV